MSSFSFHWQLAHRILREKGNRFAKPIIRLSVFGVALGVVIMLTAIGVTAGYKHVIEEKVVAMGQHIRISHYDRNYSHEQIPITLNDTLLQDLRRNPEVSSIQPYATKVGIIKTPNQVEGIVLTGVDASFNGRQFAHNLVEGDTWATKFVLTLCRIHQDNEVSHSQEFMKQVYPNMMQNLQ